MHSFKIENFKRSRPGMTFGVTKTSRLIQDGLPWTRWRGSVGSQANLILSSRVER